MVSRYLNSLSSGSVPVDRSIGFYSAQPISSAARFEYALVSTIAAVHRLWFAEHHPACRALSPGLRHRMLVECHPARAQSTAPPDHCSGLPTRRGQMLESSYREFALPIDSDASGMPIGSLAH